LFKDVWSKNNGFPSPQSASYSSTAQSLTARSAAHLTIPCHWIQGQHLNSNELAARIAIAVHSLTPCKGHVHGKIF